MGFTDQQSTNITDSKTRDTTLRRNRASRSLTPEPSRRKKSKRSKKLDEPRTEIVHRTNDNKLSETEEEYDARLEREELQRQEAVRRQELERIKKKYEREIQSVDGVRFKGLDFIFIQNQ